MLIAVTMLPAYIGPGAGFAFLGSFLTLLLSVLAGLASLLIWPFRIVWLMLRRKRGAVRKLVFLGFDGLDPKITERLMAEGKLPHFSRLKNEGGYRRLRTTYPALSPVEDHILSSTSVIQQADYKGHFKKYYSVEFDKTDTSKVRLYYRVFDNYGTEEIKLKNKPSVVLLNDGPLKETAGGEGYAWAPVEKGGGVLLVRRKNGNKVIIME